MPMRPPPHFDVAPGGCVRFPQLVEVARGCAVGRCERVLDDVGDFEEGSRPSRNAATATSFAALNTHGIGSAALAGLAREREQRERVEIGREELERARS